MPGIFGLIDRNHRQVPEKIPMGMGNSMKHEEFYIHNWMILDSCALGIVELESSYNKNSLVCVKDGSLACVLRGNVYNKKELSEKFGIENTSSHLNDAQFIILFNVSR